MTVAVLRTRQSLRDVAVTVAVAELPVAGGGGGVAVALVAPSRLTVAVLPVPVAVAVQLVQFLASAVLLSPSALAVEPSPGVVNACAVPSAPAPHR